MRRERGREGGVPFTCTCTSLSAENRPHGKGGNEEERKGEEKEIKFDGAKLLQVTDPSVSHSHVSSQSVSH